MKRAHALQQQQKCSSKWIAKSVNHRYLENNFRDGKDVSASELQALQEGWNSQGQLQIRQLLHSLLNHTVTTMNQRNFSIYTGTAGHALGLWVAARWLLEQGDLEQRSRQCGRVARQALTAAMAQGIESQKHKHKEPSPSFYTGLVGVYTLAAIEVGRPGTNNNDNRNKKDDDILPSAAASAKWVVDYLPQALLNSETELLYGLAGYLQCLLILKAQLLPKDLPVGWDDATTTVFDTIVQRGLQHQLQQPDKPFLLAFSFHNKYYLGAAHGLAGVLYVLLRLPDLCRSQKYRPCILQSLYFLLDMQDGAGNWPTRMIPKKAKENELVHWCHGASGILPTLVQAHKVFGHAQFLEAAQKGATCIWKRGLLRKGTGICHGMSGSSLALRTLYYCHQVKDNEDLLYEANRLMEATWDPQVLDIVARTEDPQRRQVGIPDHPASLFEGNFGLLYSYLAMQQHKDKKESLFVSFPGYGTGFLL